MSFEPVDVYVKDAMDNPIQDVLVHIYNASGDVFFTRSNTDVDGRASFLLETLDYTMRFNKFKVSFLQPQSFTVLAAPELNAFDVVGEPFIFPFASDARLCRCSGYFRDLDGSPKRDLDIHFIAQFNPVLLDEAAVIAGERHGRTDEQGYFQIDLIRGAQYLARIQDQPGLPPRCINVPDEASANLPNLLLPIVGKVAFDPAGPFAVSVGVDLEVVPTVYDSAGVVLVGAATADVKWSVADPTIAAVLPSDDKLTIRGLSAGTTQLLAERLNQSIIKIPDPLIEGQPLDIVVS